VVNGLCFVFNLRYNLAAALVPPCHLSNDTDHGTGAVPFKAVDMEWNCISCKRDFDSYTHPTFDQDYPVCDKCWYWHEEYRQDCNEYARTGRPQKEEQDKSKSKKAPIPADVRWTVWERDNFTCKACGSRTRLTVDHIYPEVKGGKATVENCQTLCKPCNSRKGHRT
jgi:5-methylcytosine-specific restriction endonuclease McrA